MQLARTVRPPLVVLSVERVSEPEAGIPEKKAQAMLAIPAQFVKKFNCKIVPIYIERINKFNFALKVYEPISYSKDETIHNITSDLNKILEKMILKNPEQWIWSHNRWKV